MIKCCSSDAKNPAVGRLPEVRVTGTGGCSHEPATRTLLGRLSTFQRERWNSLIEASSRIKSSPIFKCVDVCVPFNREVRQRTGLGRLSTSQEKVGQAERSEFADNLKPKLFADQKTCGVRWIVYSSGESEASWLRQFRLSPDARARMRGARLIIYLS